MSRFPSFFHSPIWFSRPAICLSLGISLGSGALFPLQARADEFAVLPNGDPIYAQLATLGRAQSAPKKPAPLTRYEAALQTARALLDLQNRESDQLSEFAAQNQWKAIGALTLSLKKELAQLGVDVEAARALANRNLQKNIARRNAVSRESNDFAPNAIQNATPRGSLMTLPQSSAATGGAITRKSSEGALEFQLSPRLRAETALQAVQRSGIDPLGAPRNFSLRANSDSKVESLSSQTALSYDLSRFLTLRAASSKLNWNGAGETALLSPLLGAPFFEGATGATATGGGVDVNVGAGLKFSTEIERLRANTGAAANRIGGGASVSAFQNRLSMNMSLSRLLPEDKTILPSTAAQLGASLDLSQRLSLNLLYQGLFAPTPSSSASRVAGGVSLSF